VQNKSETVNDVIKKARQATDITVEKLAEKTGITERYLYRIENEGKVPSYDVLNKLVHALNIPPDLIFNPKKPSKVSEIESLARMLYNCDKRSLEIIKATVKAALESQALEKQETCSDTVN